MPDSFIQVEQEFTNWAISGFPGSRSKTIEFIEHIIHRKEGKILWKHQKEAILRTIYSFEIQNTTLKTDYLLKIVTGGGKSLIIATIIAWLKFAYENEIQKFIIVCPNLIVRDIDSEKSN